MHCGRYNLMIGMAVLAGLLAAGASAQTIENALTDENRTIENRSVEVRIKDITEIPKVRDNQLTGIGLVTGLNGTGDGLRATRQAIINLLKKMDLNVSIVDVDAGNVALVLVSATLPPFARNGNRIDVTVTSIGDASSLLGGILVQTPLSAATGDVYAVADGAVTLGGFSAQGQAASVQKNHTTVGIVSEGAIIEREVPTHLLDEHDGTLMLTLKNPDFETAYRVAQAINGRFKNAAKAKDMKAVEIKVPKGFVEEDLVGFVARVQALTVEPDTVARVVINARTGTIVSGSGVRISKVAITHGSLIITIAESPQVSQPLPYSKGDTARVPRTDVGVSEPEANWVEVPDNASVADLAQALHAIGVTPRDLMEIFQLIKKAGALHADLKIM
jgi:flagellar P-ring protein precursor FlgI